MLRSYSILKTDCIYRTKIDSYEETITFQVK